MTTSPLRYTAEAQHKKLSTNYAQHKKILSNYGAARHTTGTTVFQTMRGGEGRAARDWGAHCVVLQKQKRLGDTCDAHSLQSGFTHDTHFRHLGYNLPFHTGIQCFGKPFVNMFAPATVMFTFAIISVSPRAEAASLEKHRRGRLRRGEGGRHGGPYLGGLGGIVDGQEYCKHPETSEIGCVDYLRCVCGVHMLCTHSLYQNPFWHATATALSVLVQGGPPVERGSVRRSNGEGDSPRCRTKRRVLHLGCTWIRGGRAYLRLARPRTAGWTPQSSPDTPPLQGCTRWLPWGSAPNRWSGPPTRR